MSNSIKIAPSSENIKNLLDSELIFSSNFKTAKIVKRGEWKFIQSSGFNPAGGEFEVTIDNHDLGYYPAVLFFHVYDKREVGGAFPYTSEDTDTRIEYNPINYRIYKDKIAFEFGYSADTTYIEYQSIYYVLDINLEEEYLSPITSSVGIKNKYGKSKNVVKVSDSKGIKKSEEENMIFDSSHNTLHVHSVLSRSVAPLPLGESAYTYFIHGLGVSPFVLSYFKEVGYSYLIPMPNYGTLNTAADETLVRVQYSDGPTPAEDIEKIYVVIFSEGVTNE